jgi:hypothetical protein
VGDYLVDVRRRTRLGCRCEWRFVGRRLTQRLEWVTEHADAKRAYLDLLHETGGLAGDMRFLHEQAGAEGGEMLSMLQLD